MSQSHPTPSRRARPEPREHRDGRRVATGEIDQRQSALGRRPFRVARERLPPGKALHHVVVASFGGARARHPEARQRAADHSRIDVLQLLVEQAQLLRLVAAQVRVDAVDVAHEVMKNPLCVLVSEVKRNRFLVAVERLEEERVFAFLVGRHVATHVALRERVLDLDHLGAEIRQLERPPRAGSELFDRDDANVCKRQRHR